MLRILQLVSRTQRRGAEVFALELSGALEARGHATRVVALYGPADGPLDLRRDDVALEGRPDHPAERVPGFHPGLLHRLAAAVDRFEADIVQVNGSRTVKYGSLVRRLRPRAPWALVYRSIGTPSDWLRGPLHRFLYRHLVLSAVDGVVAVSERTRSSLDSAYGLRVPTAVLPRGVDPERFAEPPDGPGPRQRLGTPPERPVLLYVGSLTAEKRPDRLLRVATDAARRLSSSRTGEDPAAELWVVGDGPERNAIDTASGDPALRLHLAGEQRDVVPWLHAADLLLLTSDTEGTPGVVLEAAAAGLPAVATRVGGVPECVEHDTTGLLADPEDEAALAAAAAALLTDAERRHRMGEAARRKVEEEFALSRLAERYERHYLDILEHRARRRGGGR